MNKGFTLLEVLIALLAAAIISIMSFEFLSNTIFLKDRIDKSIQDGSKHSQAIHLMRLDLMQAVPFKMKDSNLNNLNTSFIGSNNERLLTFIALNAHDRSNLQSNLRRIIYTYKDNKLSRLTTLANNESVILSNKLLLTDITNLNIYFGDEITDLVDYYPSPSVSENVNFPTYVLLTYDLENKSYKQVLSFFR